MLRINDAMTFLISGNSLIKKTKIFTVALHSFFFQESIAEDASDLKEKLKGKTKEAIEKDCIISNLETKLSEEIQLKNSLEVKLKKLNEDMHAEKKLFEEINSCLEKERQEKDEMMMRNAQISQEVELSKQEHRKQELESNELHSRITELESKLKDKQKVSHYEELRLQISQTICF